MEQLQKLVSEAYCNSGGMELAKALLKIPKTLEEATTMPFLGVSAPNAL